MKTIKFRGKRIDNGEWVSGGIDMVEDKATISWERKDAEGDLVPWFADVEPETVTQFTGLYDANFTPIFEGDILKGTNERPNVCPSIVAYDTETAQFIGYRCSEDLSIIGDPEGMTFFHPAQWDATRKLWYFPKAVVAGNLWDIQKPETFVSSCLMVDTFAEFRKHFQG